MQKEAGKKKLENGWTITAISVGRGYYCILWLDPVPAHPVHGHEVSNSLVN